MMGFSSTLIDLYSFKPNFKTESTVFFKQLDYKVGVSALRVKWCSFHEKDDFILVYPLFDDFLSILVGELYFGLFLEIWIG